MADMSVLTAFAYLVIAVIGIAALALIALVVLLWYDERRDKRHDNT